MKSSGVAKWSASMAFWRQLHAGVATAHPPPMRLCLPCHQGPHDVTRPPLAPLASLASEPRSASPDARPDRNKCLAVAAHCT